MREYIENYRIVKRSKLPKMGQKLYNGVVVGVNFLPLESIPDRLPEEYIYYKVCLVNTTNTYIIDFSYYYYLYAVKKSDFKKILNKLIN